MNCRIILAAILAVGLTGAATAAPKSVPGHEVAKRVDDVMKKIAWTPSLDEAKKLAEKSKKPIFYMQIVGDLDGGL